MNFNYYLPVNICFGPGKLEVLGIETKKYGTRALLVTGQNSTKKTGLLDRAIKILEKEKIEVVVFDQVSQNPLSTTAYEGVKIAQKEKCDVVVAIGGGSIMDCAKAIAFMVYNSGDIFDYIYDKKQGTKSLPLVLVPTTCGTGSEGNCFAVLTNPETNDKKSLRNITSIAKVSIVDPELMTTMPKSILASVGFDALCHNIEAYLSKNTQPFVEIQALYAIDLIGSHLTKVYQGDSNIESYSKLSIASTIGGMAINMAGVIAPHGLEHPASGLKDIVHGKGLAALSPVIYQASLDSAPDKFKTLAVTLGGHSKEDFVPIMNQILESIDLKISLGQQGIKEEDVLWMAQNAMKVSAASIANHPKVFTQEEIIEIYYKAI